MAYGIEEIAEMQVTGPVKGGDMVIKPDQAPVGAAALLNKMQNKNTPGIFKLPSPDKDMPDFMKVAAEGVEKETAQGDTINIMAGELMRQGVDTRGMGMDDVIRIYEQTFGSEKDAGEMAEVKPWDWRTILKMIQSGMTMEDIEEQMPKPIDNETAAMKFPGNFTGRGQDVTELPRNLKTGPDADETKLAYITDDEQALLAFMKPGTPHKGPKGVPSYDSMDYYASPSGTVAGATPSSYDIINNNQQNNNQPQPGGGAATAQAGADFAAVDDDDKDLYMAQAMQGAGFTPTSDGAYGQALQAAAGGGDSVETGVETGGGGGGGKGNNWGFQWPNYLQIADEMAAGVEKWEDGRVKKFLEGSVKDTAPGMGSLMYRLENNSDDKSNWFAERGDVFDEAFEGEKLDGMPIQAASDEDKFQFLVDKYTGNKKFDKNYKPKEYYGPLKNAQGEIIKESSAEYQKRMQDKGVTAKELAQAQAQGKLGAQGKEDGGFTRANTMMIEEGRKRLREDRDGGQGNQKAGGGYAGPITEKEIEVVESMTPNVSGAGSWNLGGTMPYTDDIATAGAEMNVPLGRRFQVDKYGKYLGDKNRTKEDIYKYATEGGYNQLESFSNYLDRRKKHLSEDPNEWFDEEGNVIFSGSETV